MERLFQTASLLKRDAILTEREKYGRKETLATLPFWSVVWLKIPNRFQPVLILYLTGAQLVYAKR